MSVLQLCPFRVNDIPDVAGPLSGQDVGAVGRVWQSVVMPGAVSCGTDADEGRAEDWIVWLGARSVLTAGLMTEAAARMASGPLIRITEMAPVPGTVAGAKMVSSLRLCSISLCFYNADVLFTEHLAVPL